MCTFVTVYSTTVNCSAISRESKVRLYTTASNNYSIFISVANTGNKYAVINNIINNDLSAVVHAGYTNEFGLERTAKPRP